MQSGDGPPVDELHTLRLVSYKQPDSPQPAHYTRHGLTRFIPTSLFQFLLNEDLVIYNEKIWLLISIGVSVCMQF